MFRLSTLKVGKKSFVFKGVYVVTWGANPVWLGGDWSRKGDQKGETLCPLFFSFFNILLTVHP
ncbi:MAG: hypothetical protein ACK5TL_00995, partial [bacterium]